MAHPEHLGRVERYGIGPVKCGTALLAKPPESCDDGSFLRFSIVSVDR
jgi:hypothetical protein